jgi:prepilin-type N-terminal cleavage/methylation domain-containing protein
MRMTHPISPAAATPRARRTQRRGVVRRGLTFLEVVFAAAILGIAALAALELLASTDNASLFSRRQALAAVEAERALMVASDAVKAGQSIPTSEALSEALGGEALADCVIAVTANEIEVDFTIPSTSGDPADDQIVTLRISNLVATVTDADGDLLIRMERPVPLSTTRGDGG